MVKLIQLDWMILFEDQLEEPSLDKVLPGVIISHFNSLQLASYITSLAILTKVNLKFFFGFSKQAWSQSKNVLVLLQVK